MQLVFLRGVREMGGRGRRCFCSDLDRVGFRAPDTIGFTVDV